MNMGHKRKAEDNRRNKSNPVAKYMNKYNTPKTHMDKKRGAKEGKFKHKAEVFAYEA
jgi:hypothetical protein